MDELKIMRLKDEALAKKAKFLNKIGNENRGYTEQEKVINDQFEDEITGYDAALRKIEAERAAAGFSSPEEIRAAVISQQGGELGSFRGAVSPRQQGVGFQPTGYVTEHRDLAEFVRACRWESERRDMSMSIGAAGGYIVPDQIFVLNKT